MYAISLHGLRRNYSSFFTTKPALHRSEDDLVPFLILDFLWSWLVPFVSSCCSYHTSAISRYTPARTASRVRLLPLRYWSHHQIRICMLDHHMSSRMPLDSPYRSVAFLTRHIYIWSVSLHCLYNTVDSSRLPYQSHVKSSFIYANSVEISGVVLMLNLSTSSKSSLVPRTSLLRTINKLSQILSTRTRSVPSDPAMAMFDDETCGTRAD
jgi:hypothetical protein